ncbi:MAG: histidine--tRNA ligase [Pirellulales bacterium]
MERIQPRTLKGFRDYLPEAMLPRERIIDTARRVFRSYGFSPIDTPALEYLEILLGKGSDETDKQLYRFQDHGGRDVGLRFDLTVPLARFAAQHIGELGTPFKRYHIATVWRGENTQRGRYREFMQCDFDTIGTTSVAADIETILVVNDLLSALAVGGFTISVNHRGILTGLIGKLGLADKTVDVLRSLDKLGKIGAAGVADELSRVAGTTSTDNEQLLALTTLAGSNDAMLSELAKLVAGSETGEAGVARLREVVEGVAAVLTPGAAERVRIEPSIARGLDYYTGLVLETTLNDLQDVGSICSGGRYDNLAELYTKEQLPGIGASLGLDRLLAAMEELKLIEPVRTPAPVFIPFFDAARLSDYQRLAAELRAAGLGAEVYPEAKKLGKQLQYADKRGFRVALVAGADEFAAGEVQVKNLASGESKRVSLSSGSAELVAAVRDVIGSG